MINIDAKIPPSRRAPSQDLQVKLPRVKRIRPGSDPPLLYQEDLAMIIPRGISKVLACAQAKFYSFLLEEYRVNCVGAKALRRSTFQGP